jgi:hypothetical protein
LGGPISGFAAVLKRLSLGRAAEVVEFFAADALLSAGPSDWPLDAPHVLETDPPGRLSRNPDPIGQSVL